MAAKKKPASKSTAKKSTATKAAKKAPASKAAKSTAKKAPAKKAAATKAAKKAPAKKASAKKAPAKKTAAAKTTATKTAPAKKAPARRSSDAQADEITIPAKYKYLHDQAWLDKQREALMSERASYTSSAERLAAEAAALMADREPGDVQFDEESGEGDTIAVERDRDLALSAAARQSVSDIDAALARLDAKTYGVCVAAGDIIPRERLEAIPEASVCVSCKTLMF
jgi:RNA polymerase-binding transcription factor DksA